MWIRSRYSVCVDKEMRKVRMYVCMSMYSNFTPHPSGELWSRSGRLALISQFETHLSHGAVVAEYWGRGDLRIGVWYARSYVEA
jgi:hypothetical protein